MNPCRFIFLSVLSVFFFCAPVQADTYKETKHLAVQASLLRPLTNDEIAAFPNKSFKEKWKFMAAYYAENKMRAATDEDILNELIKLNPKLALTVIKASNQMSEHWKSFKEIYEHVVSGINLQIAEENPDHPEYLIDPNDIGTLKNLSHIADIQIFPHAAEYIFSLSNKASFSAEKQMDYGYIRLRSCARKTDEKEILTAVDVILNDGYTVLRQKEGEKPTDIVVNLDESENIKDGRLFLPVPKQTLFENGRALVYRENVIFPMTVSVDTREDPAWLRASLTFDLCKDGQCSRVTTPVVEKEYDREMSYETAGCYELHTYKHHIPQFDKTDLTLAKVSLKKTKQGTFLFALLKTPFLQPVTPRLMIVNESGLHFEEPFYFIKNNQILFKSKLLSEEPSFPMNLRLMFVMADRAFEQNVRFDAVSENKNLFDATFSDYLNSFFFGMEFLFLTPFLTVLCLLFYKGMFTEKGFEDDEKRICSGICLVFALFVAFMKLSFDFFPSLLLSGEQFASPFGNALFSVFFASTPFWLPDMFGKKKETLHSEAVFMALCAVLTVMAPQVSLFYKMRTLFETQSVGGVIIFSAGFLWPFAFLLFFVRRLYHKQIEMTLAGKMVLCSPLLLQAVFLSALIGEYTDIFVFVAWTVALCGCFALLFYVPAMREIGRAAMCGAALCLFALLFVPLTLDNKTTFSSEQLTDDLDADKQVYLNVTTPGCLSCAYNRMIFKVFSSRSDFFKENLKMYQVSPMDEEIGDYLKDAENFNVPANIIYSPNKRQGTILAPVLSNEKLLLYMQQINQL